MAGKKGMRKAPRVLRDIRWGYEHRDDGKPGTKVQEAFRKQCQEDVMAYAKFLQQQEAAYAGKAGVGAATAAATTAVAPDDGTERCLETIDRLLKEFEDAESARVGKAPAVQAGQELTPKAPSLPGGGGV